MTPNTEGTDRITRRALEAFEEIPFVHLLGLEFGEVGPGAATFHLDVRPELMRHGGLLHGGVTASLIDTTGAFAVMTLLDPGEKSATIDLSIHFLRPLKTGRVTAIAKILKAGRNIVFASVEVFDSSQILVATALTTYARS
jgi:uncharacterized protein (TIGR00369 family)